MTNCYRTIVNGKIDRFSMLPEINLNSLDARIVFLLKDDERLFSVDQIDYDSIEIECSLFRENDLLEISGYEVEDGDFLITKIINITLSEKIGRLVKINGYNQDIYKTRNINLVGE